MRLSKKQKRNLCRILVSAVGLFLLGGLSLLQILPDLWYIRLPLFLLPYALVGWDVWRKAICNLANGQLLDENFLMALATVGAIALEEYPEAVFVMLFYQVGELFQSVAVGKSRRSIAALMEIRPDTARVLRDGIETELSPDEVAVGEILVVRSGERLALDGTVIEGHSSLNTLSLTGEALPREVGVGDAVYSGCVNIGGLLYVRVEKPFAESTVSKILELVENSALVKSKAETAVTKFAHWYTPTIVAIAAAVALIPSIVTGEWHRWVESALIFLVVSCPCALVISVPLSYFGGLGAASRHGVLIKGGSYLEVLSKVNTVVFDKTGTLTHGRFSVAAVYPASEVEPASVLRFCAAAEGQSNHPIAQSVCNACLEAGMEPLPVTDVEELLGLGVCARVEGSRILAGNMRLMEQYGIVYTPVSTVGSVVYVARDMQYLGAIVVSDSVKDDAKDAMVKLRSVGVDRVVMLTGDKEESARALSKQLGMDAYRAELLPADKVAYVETLLGDPHCTAAFVGDGVNDAPVLARADVGIAMGALGSDAAIEAADVVLMDDSPMKLVTAIRISRFTRRIVLQNIVFALAVKGLFLLLGLFGLTDMWAATFADVGVAVIAILNAMRTLNFKFQ